MTIQKKSLVMIMAARKLLMTVFAVVICICVTTAANCGGGFGSDCGNAKDAAPGFFGPDSLRR